MHALRVARVNILTDYLVFASNEQVLRLEAACCPISACYGGETCYQRLQYYMKLFVDPSQVRFPIGDRLA